MSKVAIVGSGLVGRAWAISFARAGHQVAIWDQADGAAARALEFIPAALDDLSANGLLRGEVPATVLARIAVAPRLEDALADVVHVQENVPEDVAIKIDVFAQFEAAAPPSAVLASSTSAILPSLFTEALATRERCLVAHPINPPHLIPAVEVVPAPWTASETVARTVDLLKAAGHAPVVMQRELDGFIVNRLQGALLEEAFRLVADGAASVDAVDVAIRDGLALRWSFMGPFETIDLNAPGGVADYVARYQKTYENLFHQMQRRVDWAGPVLGDVEAQRRARVPEADLADRQRWRDRRLMALLAHKRQADDTFGK